LPSLVSELGEACGQTIRGPGNITFPISDYDQHRQLKPTQRVAIVTPHFADQIVTISFANTIGMNRAM